MTARTEQDGPRESGRAIAERYGWFPRRSIAWVTFGPYGYIHPNDPTLAIVKAGSGWEVVRSIAPGVTQALHRGRFLGDMVFAANAKLATPLVESGMLV